MEPTCKAFLWDHEPNRHSTARKTLEENRAVSRAQHTGLPAGGRYLSTSYSRRGRGSGSIRRGRSGLGAASAGARRLELLCKARTDAEPAEGGPGHRGGCCPEWGVG